MQYIQFWSDLENKLILTFLIQIWQFDPSV